MFPTTSSSVFNFPPSQISLDSLPAPALYHEPRFRDWGLRWSGARGHGGILMDSEAKMDSDENGEEAEQKKHQWIPQYQLESFWKRKIPPLRVGLNEPLIPPRCRKANDIDHLPLPFNYGMDESELYNRNLLAARYFEETEDSGAKLKIWTVNERSKRHYLEGFQFDLSRKGHPLPSSLHLFSDRKLKMVPPEKFYPDADHFPREPLLEIRTSTWSDSESTTVFLRSPTLLRMLRVEESGARNELVPIFNSAVKYFVESDITDNQLAVVDHGGRVWMHDVNSESPHLAQKLQTVTNEEIYQRVAFSDHPQILAVSGNWHLETVDIRSPSRCVRLWDSPKFSGRRPRESLRVPGVPPPPATIRHLVKVPETANMYVVMTDHAMHVLDDRFPGNTVLHVQHAMGPSGMHRMIISNGVRDTEGGGMVYTVYCLDQVLSSIGLVFTQLYHHVSGLWSSTHGFHAFGSPDDLNRAVRRGKYAEGERILAEPTRAMCLVEGISASRSTDKKQSILIRALDDGSVWWQLMSHEVISDKKMEKASRESVIRIDETRNGDERWKRTEAMPVWADKIDEEWKQKPEEQRKIHGIHVSGITRSISESLSQKCTDLIQKSRNLAPDPKLIREKAEALPLDDANSVLSEIVINNFRDTRDRMKTVRGAVGNSGNPENLEEFMEEQEEEALEESMKNL